MHDDDDAEYYVNAWWRWIVPNCNDADDDGYVGDADEDGDDDVVCVAANAA